MWSVLLLPRAKKELTRLEREHQLRITGALELLARHPYPPKARKVSGWDAWRVRVGDYRIVYTVQEKEIVIVVIRIGHRRDVYRTR